MNILKNHWNFSDAYNDGTPEQRKQLHAFVKSHTGVRWYDYAQRSGDTLNARAIGFIGMVEPQFDKTLEEIIAANDDEWMFVFIWLFIKLFVFEWLFYWFGLFLL